MDDIRDDTTDKHDATNSSQSIVLADSGVDLRSLTKLIDDRVETKLRERVEPPGTTSDEELVETIYARRTGSVDQTSSLTRDNYAEIEKMRKQNIIIHGINEGQLTDAEYLPSSSIFSRWTAPACGRRIVLE